MHEKQQEIYRHLHMEDCQVKQNSAVFYHIFCVHLILLALYIFGTVETTLKINQKALRSLIKIKSVNFECYLSII